MKVRIDTLRELREAWAAVAAILEREIDGGQRLKADPVGTLTQLGYVLGPVAASALLAACAIPAAISLSDAISSQG